MGMDTGLTVTHPLTGEQVPVWVANYVLMSYGSGAVMAVLRMMNATLNLPINTSCLSIASFMIDQITNQWTNKVNSLMQRLGKTGMAISKMAWDGY